MDACAKQTLEIRVERERKRLRFGVVELSSAKVEWSSRKVEWSSGVVELFSRKVEWSSGEVEWSSAKVGQDCYVGLYKNQGKNGF